MGLELGLTLELELELKLEQGLALRMTSRRQASLMAAKPVAVRVASGQRQRQVVPIECSLCLKLQNTSMADLK